MRTRVDDQAKKMHSMCYSEVLKPEARINRRRTFGLARESDAATHIVRVGATVIFFIGNSRPLPFPNLFFFENFCSHFVLT